MTALAFLIDLHEPHFLQNLIKNHIVDLLFDGRRNTKSFDHSIVLFDKFLSNILLVVHIYCFIGCRNALVTLTFELPSPFLSSKGIFIKQLVYWTISC